MLGKIATSVQDILDRFAKVRRAMLRYYYDSAAWCHHRWYVQQVPYTLEVKYDGMRAQMHLLPDKTLRIFRQTTHDTPIINTASALKSLVVNAVCNPRLCVPSTRSRNLEDKTRMWPDLHPVRPAMAKPCEQTPVQSRMCYA